MKYRSFVITEEPSGNFTREIKTLDTADLPQNEVLIKVYYSSLNYKDALSASGNKGITRYYPHTPGIDAAGIVVSDKTKYFTEGQQVIVTGYDLGMNTLGGFGEYISVPAGWVVPLPAGLTLKESMMLGTAGFTAALSLYHLLRCGQSPALGPVLVTGATGGVGSIAIMLLSQAGFEVIAATGKESSHGYLKKLGASQIISREMVDDTSGKLLLRPRWAGAIDNVGGNILATVLKACSEHGNITSCGNALSSELHTTVFPFILNGVTLIGINTATTPMNLRMALWKKLSTEWKPSGLHSIVETISLEKLDEKIHLMLQGKLQGRYVVEHEQKKF